MPSTGSRPLEDHEREVGDALASCAEGAVPPTTRPCWSLAVHRAGATVLVCVHGQLTAAAAPGIDHILRDLICEQGNRHLAVDIGDVSAADADGVAVLVEACRLASEHRARLVLQNPSHAIEHALDRWREDHVVTEGECGSRLPDVDRRAHATARPAS